MFASLFATGSGNTAVPSMRNASGHNYWNSSFIMDVDVAMGQNGRYHVPQNAFLVSKNDCFLRQPNASQKCNQHYVIIRNTFCSKYANQYFPYWKILFLSSILKKTLFLRNHVVDFVEICNFCARKAIIKAAKRIINSD